MTAPNRTAALQHRLLQAWTGRGPLACLLWPLSLLMWVLVSLRRWAYRLGWFASHHAGVPTVVVGNVVAGGAGKTPTAIAVLNHLKAQGWQPGLISRGHGRVGADCREVHPDSLPQHVGDEPLLIHRATGVPVFVARQRIDAARALLAQHPSINILVCDDGLQHLALQRDIEIGVFDERGIGNGWLLPAGPLREPWPRALDIVLHTAGQPSAARRAAIPGYSAQRQLAAHAVRADGQHIALADLRHQPLLAVAGIARPEAFFSMLRDQGLTLAQTQSLPDHYDYADWQAPADHVGATPLTMVCTEKDAAKLWAHQPQAWAVPLQLTPEAGFFTALDQQLARLSSRHGHQTA